MQRSLTLAVVGLLSLSCPGQAPGFLQVRRLMPPGHAVYRATASGDVDGDGRDDLVLAGYERHSLWLSQQDGRLLEVAGAFPPSSIVWSSMALADLDGDGDLDCVVAGGIATTSGQVRWFRNHGGGVFGAGGTLSAPIPQTADTDLAIGDIDNDGDADIVLASSAGIGFPNTGLFRNDGAGNFTPVWFALNGTAATCELADFDGDGDLDLLYGVQLRTNDGTGTFTPSQSLSPGGAAFDASATDTDLDGDVDIVFHHSNGVALAVNDGNASFAIQQLPLPHASGSVRKIVVADRNGDDRPDCVVASLQQNRLAVGAIDNQPTGWIVDPTVDLDLSDAAFALLDLEQDGDLDLVPADYRPPYQPLRNDGTGEWTAPASPSIDAMTWSLQAAAGDLDDDGNTDIVSWSSFGGRTLLNDGTGRFVDQGLFSTTFGISDCVVADFDADGLQDILTSYRTNPGSFRPDSALFRNQGGGSFQEIPIPGADATHLRVADLDGDGDLDAHMADSFVHTLAIRQPNGTFNVQPSPITLTSPSSVFAELADLDGDGDMDLIGSSTTWQLPQVFENDGSANFNAWPAPSISIGALVLATCDADGDGDIDLIVRSTIAQDRLTLLRNDGTGTFTPDTTSFPSTSWDHRPDVVADFDDDGDLDVLATAGLEPPTLYRNDGTGTFTASPDPTQPAGMIRTYLLGADFDDDGDTDVLSFATPEAHVLRNLHRQLTWRTLPRIGRPLTFDFFGRANDPYVLAYALTPANIPIAGLGTLRLDPTGVNIARWGSHDANGRDVWTMPIPNVAALVGLPVYFQTLAGAQPRLGNLEVATLRAR